MRYLSYVLIFVGCAVICSGQNFSAKIVSPNLYVSPEGSDSNPGTIDKPFATLGRARDAVREFKRGVPKPVTVLLRGGTYYLSGPVVFGAQDSGTDLQPITYAAYPGEKPTLSGGLRIDAKWQAYRGGIMKCSVPKGLDSDQLFINGVRQMRARYPNYDPDKPLLTEGGYLKATGGGGVDPYLYYDVIHTKKETRRLGVGYEEITSDDSLYFHWDPETFTKKKWARPKEAIVHIFASHYWHNLQYWVDSIDWDDNRITLGEGGWHANQYCDRNVFSSESRFFVDNVFEELDTPGEWYLDKKKNILYYLPPEGVDLAGATVEMALTKHIIEIKGQRNNTAKHIHFEGIRFTNTKTTYLEEYNLVSTGAWGIYPGGAVLYENAEDCSIKDCFFDQLGGNAVFIKDHNRRITVYGNTFSETGDSAVCLVGKSHLDTDLPMPCPYCGEKNLWGLGDEPKDFPAYCDISNNYMHHLGEYGKQIAGVFMGITLKNTVRHNYMHHLPRAAICINDPFFGGHIIAYNDIHDTVQVTNDHGTINSWGRTHYWCFANYNTEVRHDPGDVGRDAKFWTVIRNNRIHERVTEKQQLAYGSTNMGIDMDDGSTKFHVYQNLVIGAGVQNRDGSFRIIENNIFINPNKGLGYHVSYENGGDKFIKNIVVKESGKSIFWVYQPFGGNDWIEQMDYNVYFGSDNISEGASFADWQGWAFGKHSVIAEPMFVDPANGDYRVKPGSPALKLGFKNFDMNNFGLLPDFTKKWGTTKDIKPKLTKLKIKKKGLKVTYAQSIVTDGKYIYTMPGRLVKYDMEGNLLAQGDIDERHFGGFTYLDGKIYCAVSECTAEGTDDHKVVVFSTESMKIIAEHDIGSHFGICAGGMEYFDEHFYVAESYYDDDHFDYIVKFDKNFKYVDSYKIDYKSPYGIQGLAYLPDIGMFHVNSHGNEFYLIDTNFNSGTIRPGLTNSDQFPHGLQDVAYLDENTILLNANGREGDLNVVFAEIIHAED